MTSEFPALNAMVLVMVFVFFVLFVFQYGDPAEGRKRIPTATLCASVSLW